MSSSITANFSIKVSSYMVKLFDAVNIYLSSFNSPMMVEAEPLPKKERHWTIPKDEEILAAVIRVMDRNKIVESQNALHTMVMHHLHKINPDYATSAEKIRKLAVRSGYVRLEIRVRANEFGKPLRCPVCDTVMEKIKNRTLTGRITTIEWKCPLCGYWTGKKLRIPRQYIFHAIETPERRRAVF